MLNSTLQLHLDPSFFSVPSRKNGNDLTMILNQNCWSWKVSISQWVLHCIMFYHMLLAVFLPMYNLFILTFAIPWVRNSTSQWPYSVPGVCRKCHHNGATLLTQKFSTFIEFDITQWHYTDPLACHIYRCMSYLLS
jgi:hypothetical protein